MHEYLKQTPHIVAHLDILGAREKMRSQETRDLFLQQINEVYTIVNSQLSAVTKRMRELMFCRIFSDNILVAKEFNIATPPQNQFYERIIHIAHFCTMFQFLALTKGLFVRGAIAYGDFIGNENFVFGEALVNAYEAENNIAIYPRVIIDKSVFDNSHSKMWQFFRKREILNELFHYDFDGQWYISPFAAMPPSFQLKNKYSYLEKVKENLFREIQNATYEKHRQKYFWLVNKFNDYCQNNPEYEALQIPLSEIDSKIPEVNL